MKKAMLFDSIADHFDVLVDTPFTLPDSVWGAVVEHASITYVDSTLLAAVEEGDHEGFVRRAAELLSKPQRKTVGWRHFVATVRSEMGNAVGDVITREEAEYMRLCYLRSRICDALGYPPSHYRAGRGLKRVGKAAVMMVRTPLS